MSKKPNIFDQDELSPDQIDIYVQDNYGCVCRVRAPRQNNERRRVQYHDRRSRQDREEDTRSPRDIYRSNRT